MFLCRPLFFVLNRVNIRNDLKSMKVRLSQQRRPLTKEQSRQLHNLERLYEQATAACVRVEQSIDGLKKELLDQERKWIAAMRQVDHEHELVLVRAGLLSAPGYQPWVDKDYQHHIWICAPDANSESQSSVQVENHNVHAMNAAEGSLQGAPQDSTASEEPHEAEAPNIHEKHNKRVHACKGRVDRAAREHDSYRDRFGKLFEEYVKAHPKKPRDVLAEDFGPQFLFEWQQRIRVYKEMEYELVVAEQDAAAALVGTEEEKRRLKYDEDFLEHAIIEENEEFVDDIDRARIDRWRQALIVEENAPTWFPDYGYDVLEALREPYEDVQTRGMSPTAMVRAVATPCMATILTWIDRSARKTVVCRYLAHTMRRRSHGLKIFSSTT
jgi:hypothetical protein